MGQHFKQVTYGDRLIIDKLYRHGISVSAIAQETRHHESTIYRELKRSTYIHTNSDLTEEVRYNPEGAEKKYQEQLKAKGRERKLQEDEEFIKFVEKMILEEHYSPQAVILYIERNHLEFKTKVCYSTIYNYIRAGVFPHLEMKDCPQPRKKQKKQKVGKKVQKRASKGTSIEKRPESINNREEVGHWEMDTVVGPQGKSKKSLLVLTERKTLKEIVELLPVHTMDAVVRTLNKLEREIGEKAFREKFKSITVDNGSEFMDVEGLESSRRNKKKRTVIYYCHPYSSYERSRNENQNRFIRRFVPKGTNFDHYSRNDVKKIERWMNDYPRPAFGGQSAKERYESLLQGSPPEGKAV